MGRFSFLLLLKITFIPITMFFSCNRFPSILLPHLIHLFSSDTCRTLLSSFISSSVGWVSTASATFQLHHRKTITYLSSLFHPNNVPVKFLKSRGKLVVITCWTCEDCVCH